ncbi:MAG TPA: hypothetical protein VF172_05450 [Nitrososphaera sp.]|jgi:hypothetical protein
MTGSKSIFTALIAWTLALTIFATATSSFAQDSNQTQTQDSSTQMNTTTGMADGNTTTASSNNTLSGVISSLQADQIAAPTWITAGHWTLESDGNLFVNDTQANITNFHATIHMILVANGTAVHGHEISDFRQTNISHVGENATTINGTFTLTLEGEPRENVHGFITLQNNKIEIWVNPVQSDNHFGITPMYGIILSPEQIQEHDRMMQQNRTGTAMPGDQNMTAGPQ